ncbi:MAG: hypothetical protein JWR69_2861 [Pedosphaera sp.]|nr:hypothetical protein [Pedosphaera sp.]
MLGFVSAGSLVWGSANLRTGGQNIGLQHHPARLSLRLFARLPLKARHRFMHEHRDPFLGRRLILRVAATQFHRAIGQTDQSGLAKSSDKLFRFPVCEGQQSIFHESILPAPVGQRLSNHK